MPGVDIFTLSVAQTIPGPGNVNALISIPNLTQTDKIYVTNGYIVRVAEAGHYNFMFNAQIFKDLASEKVQCGIDCVVVADTLLESYIIASIKQYGEVAVAKGGLRYTSFCLPVSVYLQKNEGVYFTVYNWGNEVFTLSDVATSLVVSSAY
jgi:hypothetical protein